MRNLLQKYALGAVLVGMIAAVGLVVMPSATAQPTKSVSEIVSPDTLPEVYWGTRGGQGLATPQTDPEWPDDDPPIRYVEPGMGTGVPPSEAEPGVAPPSTTAGSQSLTSLLKGASLAGGCTPVSGRDNPHGSSTGFRDLWAWLVE